MEEISQNLLASPRFADALSSLSHGKHDLVGMSRPVAQRSTRAEDKEDDDLGLDELVHQVVVQPISPPQVVPSWEWNDLWGCW